VGFEIYYRSGKAACTASSVIYIRLLRVKTQFINGDFYQLTLADRVLSLRSDE